MTKATAQQIHNFVTPKLSLPTIHNTIIVHLFIFIIVTIIIIRIITTLTTVIVIIVSPNITTATNIATTLTAKICYKNKPYYFPAQM